EAGRVRDDSTVLPRVAVPVEDRQLDPVEVVTEAGAPDHVGHANDAVVLEHGHPVADARDPHAHPLDSRRLEVGRLDTQERGSVSAQLRGELAFDRRPGGQHAGGEEPKDWEYEPRDTALEPERNL